MSARVSYLTQRTSAAYTHFAMGDIADLIQKFDDFAANVTGRLDKLELTHDSSVKTSSSSAQVAQSKDQNHAGGQQQAVGSQDGGAQGAGVSQSDFVQFPSEQLLQDQFKTIKDTLSKVKLPLGYKTDISLKGVGRQHTGSAKVINNCCEYAETLMKYVLCLSAGETISDENINTLMNILAAQIKYLQSEKAVCFVNGKFGENVGTLFREFKSHSSVFSPEDVQTLEHVAQLANAQQTSQRGRGNRGSRGGYRHSGNGYFGGNRFNWRGGSNFNNRSNFNSRGGGAGTDGGHDSSDFPS